MKTPSFAYLTFYCSILLSCTAKIIEKNEKDNSAFIKEQKLALDSSRFDIKKYDERRMKEGHYDFYFTENGKEIRQRYSLPERDSPDFEGEYVEEISKKWSPFIIRKKYDYLGRLRRWSETFRLEGINKSYEYDEQGKVIKITDREQDFKHSFEDIRDFLLKARGIDIYDTRQAIARRVNHRDEDPSQVYYTIDVFGKKDENNYLIVIFDETLELKEYRNEKDFE